MIGRDMNRFYDGYDPEPPDRPHPSEYMDPPDEDEPEDNIPGAVEDRCERCGGEGVIERLATPDEVDNGCELGIAFDPCPVCAIRAGHFVCNVCYGKIVNTTDPDGSVRWSCPCGRTFGYRAAWGSLDLGIQDILAGEQPHPEEVADDQFLRSQGE